jgi:hypothetical protein
MKQLKMKTMKTTSIFLFVTLLFLSACNKESPDKPGSKIIVGGLYLGYTEVVLSKTNSTINISDSIYQFNRIEAQYYSYKPTTNQNVLVMTFTDTLSSKGKRVEFDIFTKFVRPEDFFQKSSMTIDSITLASTSVFENFFNANAILTWDTAFFENFSFKGKGYFEFIDTLKCIYEPSKYYPKQRINFEFK